MTRDADQTSTTPEQLTCHVCGAAMPSGASQCERCGATQGDEHKCPFCGAVAAARPHPTFRYACPVCGGPRVPSPTGSSVLPDETIRKLREAKSWYASEMTWKIASMVTFAFGLFAAFLLAGVTVIASPPALAVLAGGFVTAMPLVFAALGWSRSKQRRKQMLGALDESWVLSAQSLVRHQGPLTLPKLREQLGLTEEQAKSIAATLGASSAIHTRTTDSGQLEYSYLNVAGELEEGDALAAKIDALAADKTKDPTQSEEDELAKQIDALASDIPRAHAQPGQPSEHKQTDGPRVMEQEQTDEQAEREALAEALAEAELEEEQREAQAEES